MLVDTPYDMNVPGKENNAQPVYLFLRFSPYIKPYDVFVVNFLHLVYGTELYGAILIKKAPYMFHTHTSCSLHLFDKIDQSPLVMLCSECSCKIILVY